MSVQRKQQGRKADDMILEWGASEVDGLCIAKLVYEDGSTVEWKKDV